MSLPLTDEDLHHLFYEDEAGDPLSFEEVQLLSPPPLDRLEPLRTLLTSPSLEHVYRASLLLASWGQAEGLTQLEALVDADVHDQSALAKHPLYGYDNVYDEISGAVHLFSMVNDDHQDVCLRVFTKLLDRYGTCQFESRLKHALLESSFDSLIPNIDAAIHRALEEQHGFLASQLVPVLAAWDAEAGWHWIPNFLEMAASRGRNPARNVAEALRYVDRAESRAILDALTRNDDNSVATEARASLEILRRSDG